MIDHRKVLILALNGPGVGGGAVRDSGVQLFDARRKQYLKLSDIA